MKPIFSTICLLLLFSCRDRETQIQPTIEDITESVYASGVVKSQNQYQVFSTVNGIIKEILVEEGDQVNAGDPIFKIFDKTAELTAENAKLAAEYAQLSENQQKLRELEMAIDLAESKMKNDSLLWERQQKLWEQSIGTKVTLEQTELNYLQSKNNFNSLQLQYKDLHRQLELNARQARNNFEISSTQAEEYLIKSETQGRVYSLLKEKGELVSPQTPLALIGDGDVFYLELQVDEYDIARVQVGQKVFVQMDSYKTEVFEAKVTKINPLLNERSRSFTVEALFQTRPDLLYPYLTAEANIVIQEKKDALTIPRSYLLEETFVMTAEKEKKKVVTGLKDYQKVEIISGLTQEDFIIIPTP